jgi:glycosyltransferase involved in cell wall biosynthesis
MAAPKISVLIPTYNGAAFLAECVESVLAQDFGDYELLISDDGSTDHTVAVIERCAAKDKRIRWWRNQSNLRAAGNFNLCLRQAAGEYIKFMCQDDVLLEKSTLRQMAAVLEEQPAVSLVGCASNVIDEKGRKLGYRNRLSHSQTWDGKDIILRCLEEPGNLIGEPSVVMFRRAATGCGFNVRYRQILDLEFFFRLLEQGQFSYIAKPLAAWRQHGGQVTAANQRSGLGAEEELWLIQEWYAKPWLKERASRQMLFMQIRHLQKLYGAGADAVTGEMRRHLGHGWYAAYWLKRKLTRPFKKLRR